MDAQIDISSLTIEDLLEEYRNLHDRHQQLKEQSEEDAQRIYELKRNLATATAAEAYLAQELEQLSLQSNGKSTEHDSKLQQELDELRRKYKELQSEHELLQQDYDAKAEETQTLKEKLESNTRSANGSSASDANAHVDCIERFSALEADNLELLQKLEELREISVQQTLTVAEKEKTNEILRDQVNCLEENLRCKRDEVEEKLQMLESAQDQLAEANSKIAMLTTAPAAERKGNSLFAEVDDQRQVMKQLLAAQKKNYIQMKKTCAESEFEIRRLKRENIAMHTELQMCSTIFCNADKTYQDKLNERIRQLIKQNDNLERKLQWTQERLRDLADEKSVLWLDSMLNFCKQETDELKKQLHSVRIHEASLEEQLRNALQDMARWRFESLKSRCVLIDRENLLTEHKISFKPNNVMEFNIKEAELQAARPRIVSVIKQEHDTPQKAPEKNMSRRSMETIELLDTPMKVEAVSVAATENVPKSESIKIETVSATAEIEIKADVAENQFDKTAGGTKLKVEMDVEKTEIKMEVIPMEEHVDTSDIDVQPLQAMRPQQKGTPVKAKLSVSTPRTINAKVMKSLTPEMQPPSPTQPNDVQPFAPNLMECEAIPGVRSILSKTRDIFAGDTKKNVQFSAMSPMVYKLSPTCTDEESGSADKENKPTVEMKYVRPKSKVTVRRIIVSTKQEKRTN